MSHNICIVNGKASVAFDVREGVPWHQLGQPHDGPMAPVEALGLAGLDYQLHDKILYTDIGEVPFAAPNHKAIVRPDTRKVIGVVGNDYTLIQNMDTALAVERCFGGPAEVVSVAGALGHGERIWFLCKLPAIYEVRPGDPVQSYLLVTSAHDGTGAHRMLFTNVRVVCQNTLTVALAGAENQVALKHTRNVGLALPLAADLLAANVAYWPRVREAFAFLASRQATNEYAMAFAKDLIPDPEEARPTRAIRQRGEILGLYDTATGADMAGRTRWGLFNAATQWIDQDRPVHKGTDRRLSSLLHEATAAGLRQRAFDLLTVN